MHGCVQVTSGKIVMLVKATGEATELGKIGKSLSEVEVKESPLQIETQRLVFR